MELTNLGPVLVQTIDPTINNGKYDKDDCKAYSYGHHPEKEILIIK